MKKMSKRKVGIWMYQNSGGDAIQKKLLSKLKERDIDAITGINLRQAIAKNGHILYNGIKLDKLDLFLSYNAGEQTQYQMYLYKALNRIIPTINPYEAFELTEDKFQTAFFLRNHKIQTADYKLCHKDDTHHLQTIMNKWSKMVYKPTDGWGGVGLTKIENKEAFNMLMPFLDQMDLHYFYVERFIDYDNTDYRVDIVNGQFVGCYGRKANKGGWKTNITSGGSVFVREPNQEVIDLALKAAKVTGLDIAGVDIIYDRKKEEYIVLEVNGIPAFATPEQEKLGLDFNDKKVDLMVDLIDQKTNNKDT
jgi:ribosomal protein S6--L-glutamate ligase